MLAMQLATPSSIKERPLHVVEVGPKAPAADELLLRVSACGVCRTDLQLVEGDLPAHQLPITPGHQIVGYVEAVGDDVSAWRIGDRAGVAWLAATCGKCERCLEGRENLCIAARFTGWDRDGGYATHVSARADFALRLPEAFEDLAAAPLLCGGVIGYRSLIVSGIRPGQRLGLFGFGASALLTLQVAVHWGCTVFVFTRSESERIRARSFGAEWAGGYDDRPPALLHAAVTFAPVGSVVLAALRLLERGGTVAINAIHLDGIPAFAYDALWWERSLRSVANFTRADARAFLELAGRIPIRTSFDTYPLTEANEALQHLKIGRVTGAAVLQAKEGG
jgi:propanol-preferring alcohol dehydrogenase